MGDVVDAGAGVPASSWTASEFPTISVASLVTSPDPLLGTVSAPVLRFDAALARLAGEMFMTMLLLRGVGLAGVQVGVPLRLFTFRAGGASGTAVNPVILDQREPYHPEEGCLSLPGRFYEPQRHHEVLAEWQEVDGSPCRGWVSGLLAEIFEHEIDHLDGRLLSRLPELQLPG